MVVLLTVALVACAFGTGIAQAGVGVEDFSYADPAPPAMQHQPTAPTGEKPQSKLWFNDGIWWGSIWSKTKYTIQGYSSTGQWVDTGVTIDPRDKSQADMLWDQASGHLYAISNVHEANSTNDPAVRLYRFSYNAAAKTYTPDWTTPVVIFQPASTTDLETVTMDTDSTGMLWATFTYANSPGNCVTKSTCPAGRSVLIAHSTVGNDQAWSAPVVLPSPDVSPGVPRATDVSGNDISAIVHFGNKIGVMYSDQTPDPVPTANWTGDYFAWHTDGAAATAWTTETALAGKRMADDHINLKAAPDGTLFAAVKTSANDGGASTVGDPLIYLLKRSASGTWTPTSFDTAASQDTRSQILLDPTNDAVYQFVTYPPDGVYESGGKIYCKVTSMSHPNFTSGRGTPFIDIAPGDHLNNFSSTKQTVGSASGLFGIAGDDVNLHYAHNSLTIVDGAAPSCTGNVIVPPVTLVPPPVTPPVTPPKPVTPTILTVTPVATPVTVPITTTPPVTTTSTACRVISSSLKVRSLSSALGQLKRKSVVRLQVRSTCSLRLTLSAALGTRHGAIVGRSSVFLKKNKKTTILVHLTRTGRNLIKHKASAKIFVTTRTPAVKGLSPARIWSTTIAFHS